MIFDTQGTDTFHMQQLARFDDVDDDVDDDNNNNDKPINCQLNGVGFTSKWSRSSEFH